MEQQTTKRHNEKFYDGGQKTKFSDDTPVRLDLVLTKEPAITGEVLYKCTLGKSIM